ncbi:MAG: porin [Gallionella sp.]|nr:porin [Gallionella sp.]
MKKKLIAVAIATAFAAPAFADNSNVEVYGKINVNGESFNTNSTAVAVASKTQFTNNASRFGVKGKEDLGDGLNAIWQLEVQIDPTGNGTDGVKAGNKPFDGTRNSQIGLKGDFGTVFMGNWDTPYKVAHNKVELFDNAGSFSSGKLIGGNAGGKSYVTRQSNVLQYWTPSVNGLSGQVALSRVTSGSAKTTVTQYSVSGSYDADGIYAALAYENRPDQTVVGLKDSATRLVGAYTLGSALVGLTYERLSTGVVATNTTGSQNNWELTGKYKFGASTLGAFYAQNGDFNGVANTGAKMVSLRYGYNFSKRTELWAAYTNLKNDSATKAYKSVLTPGSLGATESGFGLGLSHTF